MLFLTTDSERRTMKTLQKLKSCEFLICLIERSCVSILRGLMSHLQSAQKDVNLYDVNRRLLDRKSTSRKKRRLKKRRLEGSQQNGRKGEKIYFGHKGILLRDSGTWPVEGMHRLLIRLERIFPSYPPFRNFLSNSR